MRATVLVSTAERVRRRIGIPVEEFERPVWEDLAGSLRKQLGKRPVRRGDGQQLSVPEAVELANMM